MKSKFIETGKIVNIHGLRGEVKAIVLILFVSLMLSMLES